MIKESEYKTDYRGIISVWKLDNIRSHTDHLRVVYNLLHDKEFIIDDFRAKMESNWEIANSLVCTSNEQAIKNWNELLENNVECVQLCGKLNKNDVRISVSMPLYEDGQLVISSDKGTDIDDWVRKQETIGENGEDFISRRCNIHEDNSKEHIVK